MALGNGIGHGVCVQGRKRDEGTDLISSYSSERETAKVDRITSASLEKNQFHHDEWRSAIYPSLHLVAEIVKHIC